MTKTQPTINVRDTVDENVWSNSDESLFNDIEDKTKHTPLWSVSPAEGHTNASCILNQLMIDVDTLVSLSTNSDRAVIKFLLEFFKVNHTTYENQIYLTMPGTYCTSINILRAVSRRPLEDHKEREFGYLYGYNLMTYLSNINITQLLKAISVPNGHHIFDPLNLLVFQKYDWTVDGRNTAAQAMFNLIKSQGWTTLLKFIHGLYLVNQNHWICWSVSILSGQVLIANSIQGKMSVRDQADLLLFLPVYLNLLNVLTVPLKIEEERDVPQQDNGYDCGLFAVLSTYCKVHALPYLYGQEDITGLCKVLNALCNRIPRPVMNTPEVSSLTQQVIEINSKLSKDVLSKSQRQKY